MEITSSALKRIRQLKNGQAGLRIGLRLGLKEKNVYLKWDRTGPTGDDLVLMKQGIPIFIDSQTYLRLTDYVLDFECDKGICRFMLRPKRNRQLTHDHQANNRTPINRRK